MVQLGEEVSSDGHKESPWDILRTLSFTESNDGGTAKERLSKKPIDVFVRRIFELNPDLGSRTSNILQSYEVQNKKLPFIHITPDIIEYGDGSVVSTGNVENIKENGFLASDSNVGGFLKAGDHYNNVGWPEHFKSPEDFLKSYILLMRHYLYHARRTNHRNSNANFEKDIVAIKPALIFVNGDLKVEHGTDYEDHFILSDGSKPEDVVGIMNVDKKIDMNDADSVLDNYTRLLDMLDEILEY